MPGLRDHQPVVLEEFNGLWERGDPDAVPIDHFSAANNVAFFESGFETRPGVNTFIAKSSVVRMYNYKTQTLESLLILVEGGSIYHALLDGSGTIHGPILTIAAMTDFGFQSFNGRAYITPFATFTDGLGNKYQKGLQNEYVYVYKGAGAAARKAAGFPPSNGADQSFTAFNSATDGLVTKGAHLVAIRYVGGAALLATEVFPVVYAPGGKQINVSHIPIGPPGTTGRQIVMTRAIDPKDYVPTQASYTYYNAVLLNDNTTETALISVADSGLTVVNALGIIPTITGLKAASTTSDGFADLGFHLFGVVYETDTGYLTAPGPENFATLDIIKLGNSIAITNIPVSPDSFVTKRHIVATRAIYNYNGDQTAYQFFFVPEGTIEDNIATSLTVSFYDADLLDDASHLMDNFSEIPAGVCLTTYHGRMVLTTTFDDVSLAYLSTANEPEAFDQVDGLIIIPLDGMPITNAQEFRDVLYIFKKTRTFGSSDNSDVPSTWAAPIPLDQGIGASIHGVAKVLDSGGVNVDFILVVDFSGIMIFNGFYARPELTFKIADLWKALDFNDFANIQLMNDSLSQILYMTLPDRQMLMGDYSNGLDPKSIKWCPWQFDFETTTIALVETNKLLIGSNALVA